jgi:hypothetical protein
MTIWRIVPPAACRSGGTGKTAGGDGRDAGRSASKARRRGFDV